MISHDQIGIFLIYNIPMILSLFLDLEDLILVTNITWQGLNKEKSPNTCLAIVLTVV